MFKRLRKRQLSVLFPTVRLSKKIWEFSHHVTPFHLGDGNCQMAKSLKDNGWQREIALSTYRAPEIVFKLP